MVESFRVNERVRINRDVSPLIEGNYGTVMQDVDITNDNPEVAVSWDGLIRGHDLNGRVEDNSGLFVASNYLEKLNPSIRPPTLSDTRRRGIMEVYESGIINQNEKNKQIQYKEEKLYINYFNKVKESQLPELKLLYFGDFKIGDIVKSNKKAFNSITSETIFTEGIIIRKKEKLIAEVLVYKEEDENYLRKGFLRDYHIKYLSLRKKHKCTLKLADEGRLFPPKITMQMKSTNMKDMIKNINNIIDVDSCSLIKGTPSDPCNYLSVITKELIFDYKKKKYNLGKYEFKYVIPDKKAKLNSNSDGVVDLSGYVTARRVKGALKMNDDSSCWFHNPYITDVNISHYDIKEGKISKEEIEKLRKMFRHICYGASSSKAEKAYKIGDYYALTEVTISNLLSISNQGFIKLEQFLPYVPLVKKRGKT